MHEALLETPQPEEQHGFRKQRRMDEPWLNATLLLDKVLDKRIRVWVVRLDQSKTLGSLEVAMFSVKPVLDVQA